MAARAGQRTSFATLLRLSVWATATPATKAAIGGTWRNARPHSPRAPSTAKRTTLPVCELAKTPWRLTYVYASTNPPTMARRAPSRTDTDVTMAARLPSADDCASTLAALHSTTGPRLAIVLANLSLLAFTRYRRRSPSFPEPVVVATAGVHLVRRLRSPDSA